MERSGMEKAFKIDIPLELRKGRESGVILLPGRKKAVITYADEEDLFELFSSLRLGLDYSPLLTTFYFQKDYTEEEAEYMKRFYLLASPLIKVWAFRNAMKYIPEEEVKREAEEIAELIELTYMAVEPENFGEQLQKQINRITSYMLLKHIAGRNMNIKLEGEYKTEWQIYVRILEERVGKKPSPYILAELPEKTSAPYRVRVKKQPFPHYEIKAQGNGGKHLQKI